MDIIKVNTVELLSLVGDMIRFNPVRLSLARVEDDESKIAHHLAEHHRNNAPEAY